VFLRRPTPDFMRSPGIIANVAVASAEFAEIP
jgi:hypothetical protein